MEFLSLQGAIAGESCLLLSGGEGWPRSLLWNRAGVTSCAAVTLVSEDPAGTGCGRWGGIRVPERPEIFSVYHEPAG